MQRMYLECMRNREEANVAEEYWTRGKIGSRGQSVLGLVDHGMKFALFL